MIAPDVVLGRDVRIFQPDLVNLYGCKIGDGTKIGAFVEIQRGAEIGKNCKISSHTFICSGVAIEDGAFLGHGVMFINDPYPRAVSEGGSLQSEVDWQCIEENSAFILGPEVAAFEEEFAAYCGSKIGVGVNSGTSALHLALLAAGIGQGDEVITTPFNQRHYRDGEELQVHCSKLLYGWRSPGDEMRGKRLCDLWIQRGQRAHHSRHGCNHLGMKDPSLRQRQHSKRGQAEKEVVMYRYADEEQGAECRGCGLLSSLVKIHSHNATAASMK